MGTKQSTAEGSKRPAVLEAITDIIDRIIERYSVFPLLAKWQSDVWYRKWQQHQAREAHWVCIAVANTLTEVVNKTSRQISLQKEKHVQQKQKGWDSAILKLRRKEVPSALYELPNPKEKAQEGVKDNQTHGIVTQAPVQDISYHAWNMYSRKIIRVKLIIRITMMLNKIQSKIV